MREMKQHQEEYRMKNSNKKEVERFQAYTNTYEKSGCERCTLWKKTLRKRNIKRGGKGTDRFSRKSNSSVRR